MTGRRALASPSLAVLVLCGAGFASLYLLFSVVPVLAAGSGGRFGAGLSTAVFMGTTVLVQFCLPAVAGRIPPHLLVAGSLLLLALPAVGYLWSTELWPVLVVTAVRGAGFGVLTVVGAALASAYSAPHRRGRALGIYGLATSFTGVVAPPLGLLLIDRGADAQAYAVALLLPVAALALLGRIRPRSSTPVAPERAGTRGLSDVWRDGRLMTPSLLFLPCAIAYGGIYSFLPLSSAAAPAALLMFGGGFAVARFLGGRLADAVHPDLLAVPLLALTFTGIILTAWTTDGGLLAGALMAGLGIGGLGTVSLVAVMSAVGAGEGALGSSVWNLTFDLGIAAGGLGLGVLAQWDGYAVVYLAAAACVGVALCVASVRLLRRALSRVA
jgi:predicted MFS family arabinose efflux permease